MTIYDMLERSNYIEIINDCNYIKTASQLINGLIDEIKGLSYFDTIYLSEEIHNDIQEQLEIGKYKGYKIFFIEGGLKKIAYLSQSKKQYF